MRGGATVLGRRPRCGDLGDLATKPGQPLPGRRPDRHKPQQMRLGVSILQLDDQEIIGVVEHAEATVGTKLEEKAIVHGAHDLLDSAVDAKADGMQHEGPHRQAIVGDAPNI
jgi:hypothetical protein